MHPLHDRPTESLTTFLGACLAVAAVVFEMDSELTGALTGLIGASSFLWSALVDKRRT